MPFFINPRLALFIVCKFLKKCSKSIIVSHGRISKLTMFLPNYTIYITHFLCLFCLMMEIFCKLVINWKLYAKSVKLSLLPNLTLEFCIIGNFACQHANKSKFSKNTSKIKTCKEWRMNYYIVQTMICLWW